MTANEISDLTAEFMKYHEDACIRRIPARLLWIAMVVCPIIFVKTMGPPVCGVISFFFVICVLLLQAWISHVLFELDWNDALKRAKQISRRVGRVADYPCPENK